MGLASRILSRFLGLGKGPALSPYYVTPARTQELAQGISLEQQVQQVQRQLQQLQLQQVQRWQQQQQQHQQQQKEIRKYVRDFVTLDHGHGTYRFWPVYPPLTQLSFSLALVPLPSPIRPPPDKLHPTLASWLKNINKLDSLINRLQELASSAPTDHRSQLFNKVAALRATFKKQQERCIEFLQLSEDYANKYLLDIDTEIRQQSTFLDNLEERLEAAEKLHGDAVDLQRFYESGTVASMNNLRATGKAVPRCLQRLQGKLLKPSIFRYLAAASTGQCPIRGG